MYVHAWGILVCVASIMSIYLLCSSIVVTLLVPQSAVEPGGVADGRALSYFAHQLLEPIFGNYFYLHNYACLRYFPRMART